MLFRSIHSPGTGINIYEASAIPLIRYRLQQALPSCMHRAREHKNETASSLIQQQKPPSKKDYATVFWLQMSLAIFIVLCCVAVVKSGVYASQLQGEGEWFLYALACSFVIGTLKTVPSIKLTRELNFAKFVIPQILEQLVFNGLLIILVINGWGLKAYTWAIWARTLIGTAVMLYLVPFWPGVNFSLASLRCSLQFGVKFQFNDLLSRLKDQFFYLFVAMQLPPEQFGLMQRDRKSVV